MYSAVVDLGPGQCNMQLCSVSVCFDLVIYQEYSSNGSAIFQINLFPLYTAVVFFSNYTGYQISANSIHFFP